MKPDTRSFYARAVQRVIERVSTHLDDAFALEELASEACLSPFHFHRVFRGMTGETPMEFVRRIRMERAAWQLARGDEPRITTVAFGAGYDTHESFTRAFRACYAVSPTGFRAMQHPRIELAAQCGVHFDPSGAVPQFIPRHSGGSHMQVEIRHIQEQRAGCVRHIGPYNQIPEAFKRLGAIAWRAGLIGKPGTSMIALYYDDPESTPPDQLRSDAAITFPDGIALPEGLTEQHVPGGDYACTLHVGPYEQLGDVWSRFMGEWLPASGRRIGDGVSYEVYLNDPSTTKPEDLKTELRMPVVN